MSVSFSGHFEIQRQHLERLSISGVTQYRDLAASEPLKSRINELDKNITLTLSADTFFVAGIGQIHIDVLDEKAHRRVRLDTVSFRETSTAYGKGRERVVLPASKPQEVLEESIRLAQERFRQWTQRNQLAGPVV